jgi:hypothetical protein
LTLNTRSMHLPVLHKQQGTLLLHPNQMTWRINYTTERRGHPIQHRQPACYPNQAIFSSTKHGAATELVRQLSTHVSFILFGFRNLLGYWQFVRDGRYDARMIHASVTARAQWWASFQTPQASDRPNRWATFSPWGAGLCTRL